MPRLSVLMPARNAESTIARAVRSTLRSLPADAELVVQDDGSTDATHDRLLEIDDRRLVVHRGAGMGVAAALNRLLAVTDSEHVARMDADDIVLPGRFRAQAHAVASGAHVVFGSVVQFGRSIQQLRPTSPVRLQGQVLRFGLLATNPFSHPTLYATRAAVEGVGAYQPCAAEDYDLWLRLAAADVPMMRLRRPVLLYRVHAGQTSVSDEWQRASIAEETLVRSYDRLAETLLGVTRSDEGMTAALSRRARAFSGAEGAWLRRQIRTRYMLSTSGGEQLGD